MFWSRKYDHAVLSEAPVKVSIKDTQAVLPFESNYEVNRRSAWLIGTAGAGKTSLIKTLLMDDVNKNITSVYIDFKGEGYYDILCMLRNYLGIEEFLQRVCVIDFGEKGLVTPINVLSCEKDMDLIEARAESIIESFAANFRPEENAFGHLMENILLNSLPIIIYHDGSWLDILKFLQPEGKGKDNLYRMNIINMYKNVPELYDCIDFWLNHFANYNDDQKLANLRPTTVRIKSMLTSPIKRSWCTGNQIQLSKLLNEDGNIILINASRSELFKGRKISLVFNFLYQLIHDIVMSRKDFINNNALTIYIDDCFIGLNKEVATSFAEYRSKGAKLVCSHQATSQFASAFGSSDIGLSLLNDMIANSQLFLFLVEDDRSVDFVINKIFRRYYKKFKDLTKIEQEDVRTIKAILSDKINWMNKYEFYTLSETRQPTKYRVTDKNIYEDIPNKAEIVEEIFTEILPQSPYTISREEADEILSVNQEDREKISSGVKRNPSRPNYSNSFFTGAKR